MVASFDEARQRFSVVGMLFAIREVLGQVFGWDGRRGGRPDASEPSGPAARGSARLALNREPCDGVHAALPDSTTSGRRSSSIGPCTASSTSAGCRTRAGGYRGQMAILVKPNGLLGHAYMAAITPFRYLIVYPRMLKGVGRKWLSYSDDRS